MRLRRVVAAWTALAALAALACGHRPSRPVVTPGLTSADMAAAALRVRTVSRTRHELTFELPQRTIEPDDVAIQAHFTSPRGNATTVGGFASRGGFVVRFTPREDGEHRFVISADAGSGDRVVARGSLVATRTDSRGFVHAAPGSHRLVDASGGTVFVLGENRINVYDPTWNYDQVSTGEYLRRMKANGMSTIRVFLFADCESETAAGGAQIGCLESGVGRFDERTADAIDVLFDEAEKSEIDVILVAFALGYTPPPETWRSWIDNPYSAERGGPAKDPVDFFANPRFRPNAARKLRYIADRWASSPRLLAIDLLNEPEWDGPIPERIWIPWAIEMSRAWRRADPYGHLVTVGSVGLQSNIDGDESAWYGSDANDIVQWHLYGKEFYDPQALAREMARKVDETWHFGKPIICGEFAYGGENKSTFDHTHAGIWSLLMSGAGALAHSAPPFEIDSDEPMTPARAGHFHALSEFLRAFDRKRELVPAHDVRVSRRGDRRDAGALVLSLVNESGDRAIWILGPSKDYGAAVDGLRLTLPPPPPGAWTISWIDDVTGKPLREVPLDVTDRRELALDVPPFVRHIAARILPR
jgi:hypothetical protein